MSLPSQVDPFLSWQGLMFKHDWAEFRPVPFVVSSPSSQGVEGAPTVLWRSVEPSGQAFSLLWLYIITYP